MASLLPVFETNTHLTRSYNSVAIPTMFAGLPIGVALASAFIPSLLNQKLNRLSEWKYFDGRASASNQRA